MSKAQRIRELLAQGLSTREVAEQVGCDPAYVRVAGRQRKDGKISHIDRAYNASAKGRNVRRNYFVSRYTTDAEFRARHHMHAQKWQRRNPEKRAAIVARYRAKKRALELEANHL